MIFLEVHNLTKFILIRHCAAQGQAPEATLTEAGFEQAQQLANFLENYSLDRIISSPFTRTIQTITPYALRHNIEIEIDERLQERVLSSENMPDWFEKLQQSFIDKTIKYTGGESSNEATHRILSLIEELKISDSETIALVSHGYLSTMLLHSISPDFGFDEWQQLTNPDVFVIEMDASGRRFKRVWR